MDEAPSRHLTIVSPSQPNTFLSEGGHLPPELLTIILSFAVAPAPIVPSSSLCNDSTTTIQLPRTRRYTVLQLRLVCKYWFSLVTHAFLVSWTWCLDVDLSPSPPIKSYSSLTQDKDASDLDPFLHRSLHLQSVMSSNFPNLQELSFDVIQPLTIEHAAYFPSPIVMTSAGLRRFSLNIKLWEKGALLALRQHMDKNLQPWALEDLEIRMPNAKKLEKDFMVKELVEMVVGWERLPSSLTSLALTAIRYLISFDSCCKSESS